MLMMEVKSGNLQEDLKRKSRQHIPNTETNTEGIKLDNRSDIQEQYTKYYKTLLKTREPNRSK